MTMPGGNTVSWGSLKKTAEDAIKPLPADWYDVTIEKAEATTSSTGKPMIKIMLTVDSGPMAGQRKIPTQFTVSPESPFALTMFFKQLAAFGLGDAFFSSLQGADQELEIGIQTIAANLLGRQARAKIEPRAYQGVERDNCSEFAIKPGAGIVANAMVVGTAGGPPIPPSGPPTPQSTPPVPTYTGPPNPGATGATPPSLPF